MANVVDILLRARGGAQVAEELTRVQRAARAFGNQIQQATRFAGVAFAAAVPAMVATVRSSLNYQDALAKAAQRTGLLVEELSALKHAADLSDVSLANLETAAKGLTQWMDRTGQSGRSMLPVLLETADLFARMADGPEKVRIAMDRFGRSGQALIPLLNQGSASIQGLMREAERFGVVVDTRAAKAAEEFNDNLTRMRAAIRGASLTMTGELVPSLVEMQQAIFAFAATEPSQVFELVGVAARWVAQQFREMLTGMKMITGFLGGFIGTFWATMNPIEAMREGLNDAKEAAREFIMELNKISPSEGRGRADTPTELPAMVVGAQVSMWDEARWQIQDYLVQIGAVIERVDELGQRTFEARGAFRELGAAIGATFLDVMQSGIHTVSQGLTSAIMQTRTWAQALMDIGRAILTSIVQSIIRMGLQWIATRVLMATVGKTMLAASLAATAPMAAAASAMWAAPATLSAIATAGGSALSAPATIAAAKSLVMAQSLAGFQIGGYTGDGPTDMPAGIVHRREFVFDAPAVSRIGLENLEGLRSGGRSEDSAYPMRVVIVDNRRDAEQLRRDPAFRSMIVDLMEGYS